MSYRFNKQVEDGQCNPQEDFGALKQEAIHNSHL